MKLFYRLFAKNNIENFDISNLFWSWVGSFLGLVSIAYFHKNFLDDSDLLLLLP
jgi:hypothetical protein